MRMQGIVLGALLFLSACAMNPESLTKSERGEQIVLTEKVSTVAYRGLHVRCEEGALPGTYVAKLEDAEGIYFYGPERPIWNTNEAVQPVPRLYVGGIYLPKDSSKPPRFFYIFEKEIHTAENIDTFIQQRSIAPAPSGGVVPNAIGNAAGGAIINAMIDADVGKIVKFPSIDDPLVKKKILDGRQKAP